MLQRILPSAEREAMEKERREKLAELARFVSGEDWSNKNNVAPVLPMNRYRFRTSKVKAASRTSPRVVLHPEKAERDKN
jgi:hypothetical protein